VSWTTRPWARSLPKEMNGFSVQSFRTAARSEAIGPGLL
jgi:hypothetical protein